MDVVDGIRARKRPDLTTVDGQLIDAYSDRMKEFSQLMSRNQYDAGFVFFIAPPGKAWDR